MKKGTLFLIVLTVFLITTIGSASAFDSPLQIGWAIGWNEKGTAVILHTKNGGRKWVVQGDNTKWAGYTGYDISAVDKQTAWAALASADDGIILHTTNGGVTWTKQTLPEGVNVEGGIKNIKGLTRHEAWAVSLRGTILHTTDGGEVWNIVDSGIVDSGIEKVEVNRMDAIGYRDVRDADRSGKNTGKIHANVWIADHGSGNWGMIHTLYNGDIWRKEFIPYLEPESCVHMVSAYSPRVAWAAAWFDGTLYRTVDGGENWESVAHAGNNDIDDMCAYSADAVWLVQFQGSVVPGIIWHVSVEGGVPDVVDFHPVDKNGDVLPYYYGGLTCVDEQTALVVGYTVDFDSSQKGIILLTNDGGKSWVRQPLPVNDVYFWKVSFVGGHR
jgi:photosystem II stability/assembly factor-like uncharacterized protein